MTDIPKTFQKAMEETGISSRLYGEILRGTTSDDLQLAQTSQELLKGFNEVVLKENEIRKIE